MLSSMVQSSIPLAHETGLERGRRASLVHPVYNSKSSIHCQVAPKPLLGSRHFSSHGQSISSLGDLRYLHPSTNTFGDLRKGMPLKHKADLFPGRVALYKAYRNPLLSNSVVSLIPRSIADFSSISAAWVPDAAASRSLFLFTDHMYAYNTTTISVFTAAKSNG